VNVRLVPAHPGRPGKGPFKQVVVVASRTEG